MRRCGPWITRTCKALPPTAQRFYETAELPDVRDAASTDRTRTLRYTDYCLLAPQPRGLTYEQVKKHMYKVHQPHVASRYLAQVQYEATTDIDGHPDWLMHYVPGPKARAEFVAFTRPLVTQWLPHWAPRARTSRRTWSLPSGWRSSPCQPHQPARSWRSSHGATSHARPCCDASQHTHARAASGVHGPPGGPGAGPRSSVLPALSWTRPGHGPSQRTGARHAAPDGAWRDQSPLSPHLCAAGSPRDRLPAQVFRRHPALPPRGAGGL